MINLTRKEREESMIAVISDVLMSGDFNPLAVSVERPRIPRVGTDGETYWQEVGICRVVIEGAVTPDEAAIHFVEDDDPFEYDLEAEDDEEIQTRYINYVEERDGAIHRE